MPRELYPSDLMLPKKYGSWRLGQRDLIEHIANSQAKYIILNSPVGVGKSLVAVAASRLLRWKCKDCAVVVNNISAKESHQRASNHFMYPAGRMVYSVPTKSLQDQISKDFPFIAQMKGKSNYACRHHPDFSCVDCPPALAGGIMAENHSIECMGRIKGPPCRYYIERQKALEAGTVVLNYAYWFAVSKGELFDTGDLLVCDEAHTMADLLSGSVSIYVMKSAFDRFNIEFDPTVQGLVVLASYLVNVVAQAQWELQHALATGKMTKVLLKKMKQLKVDIRLLGKLRDAIGMIDVNWIAQVIQRPLFDRRTRTFRPETCVTFEPVWVSNLAPRLFERFKKVLFMSATIFDKEEFCKQMGIPPEQTEFIRVEESLFDKDRRKVVFLGLGSINRGNEDAMLPIQMGMIDDILEAHKNEKGLIHTSSMRNANYFYQNSKYQDRIRVHFDKSREAVIGNFKKSSEPLVLLSPSIHTGESFDFDLARWQIITRAPYADLSDKKVKIRLEQRPKWYVLDMLSRFVQATGRICRDEQDFGITYVLDDKIEWAIANNKDIMPRWFMESIVTLI